MFDYFFCSLFVYAQDEIIFKNEQRLALEKHCFACHSHKKTKGKLNLEDLIKNNKLFENLEKTQSIRDALIDFDMPPEDETQPSDKLRKEWIQVLDKGIHLKQKQKPHLKPIPIRRLTRYEYNNVVRDLFSLKTEVFSLYEKIIIDKSSYWNPANASFPHEMTLGNRAIGRHNLEAPPFSGVLPYPIDHRAESGFNNRGDQLSLSPLLLEKYFELAQSIMFHKNFPKHSESYKEEFSNLQEDDAVKQRIQRFLGRAWRQNVKEKDVQRYFQKWQSLKEKEKLTDVAAMKMIMAAALSSPKFIYVSEERANGIEKVNDLELANRLAMFLWSSLPDQELRDRALKGQLSSDANLAQEINRMMKDKRIKALSENFALQWLQLDRLISSFPDRKKFAAYYFNQEKYRIGTHMMIEPLLLFECIMIENQSILHFIDHDEAYLSPVLQEWYEKKAGQYNSKKLSQEVAKTFTFKRTKLMDKRRGGLLTSAATLTMNSGTHRSSPILRGAWVANVIFNDPPPPPPANVPELENEKENLAKGLSLREQLKAHLINDQCRSCHSRIDPLGFALENYNAIGQWHDRYEHNIKIDRSGKLFGKTHFKTVAEFKDALLKHKDKFARGFIEKMLSYALGRSLDSYDRVHVDQILSEVKTKQYTFSSVIHGIVKSYPFRYKNHQNKEISQLQKK